MAATINLKIKEQKQFIYLLKNRDTSKMFMLKAVLNHYWKVGFGDVLYYEFDECCQMVDI